VSHLSQENYKRATGYMPIAGAGLTQPRTR